MQLGVSNIFGGRGSSWQIIVHVDPDSKKAFISYFRQKKSSYSNHDIEKRRRNLDYLSKIEDLSTTIYWKKKTKTKKNQQTLFTVRGKSRFIQIRDWPDISQRILIYCLQKVVIVLLACSLPLSLLGYCFDEKWSKNPENDSSVSSSGPRIPE